MKNIKFGSVVLAFVFCLAPKALPNPLGGVVTSGSAAITSAGNLLTINQSSSAAIINWGSFNIAGGQTTTFQFNGVAGANSAVLNRVAVGNPSTIAGLLQSTIGPGGPIGGTVYVLNPSGILFTPTAEINVGNFVATTLPISDSQFLNNNGTLNLSGSSTAGIQNQGSINALGNIYLIANTVENSGTISAGGFAGLAAGTTVTLVQSDDEQLSVTAGAPAAGATGVENTPAGVIKATVAELTAAGGNIYALAINNGGVVRASTITQQGGHIYLTAPGGNVVNSGTLDASGTGAGAVGGQVQVTGGQVTLASGSTVNVSGNAGGGTALIGGGLHGADSSVPDAQQTTVEQGATINANATGSGNGGNVVVWSDNDTTFAGQILAEGGASGGNGGFAEVSGGNLDFGGWVDTLAPEGLAGNLLLDPTAMTIDNGSASPGDLTWATILSDLTGGNVEVTSASYINVAAGNMDAGGPGDLASANTLTLDASTTLTLGSAGLINIQNTGGGGFIFEGGTGINLNANVITENGAVEFANPVTLTGNSTVDTTDGGLGTADITFDAGADINGSAGTETLGLTAGASTITLQNVGASEQIGSLTTDAASTTTLNEPTVDANSVDFKGAVTLENNVTIEGSSTGPTPATSVDFENTVDGGETLTINSAATEFGANVGATTPLTELETIDGSGASTLADGGSAITINAGTVQFADAVTLDNGVTVEGSTAPAAATLVDFENTVDGMTAGNQNLTVNAATVTFDDKVGNTGAGGATALGDLTTEDTSGSGSTVLGNTATDPTMAVYAGSQNYYDAVMLGANTTLAGGNNLTPAASVAFQGTVDGAQTLTINSAETTFYTSVGTTTPLTELETIDGAGASTLGAGGGTFTINAGTVQFADAVTLDSGVTVEGSTAPTPATLVNFENTVDGGQTLTINSAATEFGANVGATTPLTELETIDGSGASTLADGGSAITINAGTVQFADAVTLDNGVTVEGSTAPAAATLVDFENTVDGMTAGNQNLTVNAATVTFDDKVGNTGAGGATALGDLTTEDTSGSGSTVLGNTATDPTMAVYAGSQNYYDAVMLGANTTLAGGNNLTPAASVAFQGTVDGAQTLTINSAETTFYTSVGTTTPLTELETIDGAGASTLGAGGGTFTINAGTVQFADAVTLDSGVTVEGSTAPTPATLVNFENTVDGGQTLTINSAATEFGANVGATTPLTELETIDGSGASTLADGGSAITINAGTVQFADAVTLDNGVTVEGSTAPAAATLVDFENTVDGMTAGNQNLTVNAATVTFDDKVGNTGAGGATALGDLTTEDTSGSGSTVLGNTATDPTMAVYAGSQNYYDAVMLGANTTLAGGNNLTPAASVAFQGTVDGAQTLTINSAETTFYTSVGTTTPLTELETIDGAGASTLGAGGGTFTINAGTVQFADAVTLDSGVTVEGSTAPTPATLVNFENTVDGGQTLTINSAATEFGANVGATTPLTELETIDGSGASTLADGGSAITINAGTVQFADAVTLDNGVTVEGSTAPAAATLVDFENTVDGMTAGNQNLTVNAATATFDDKVGNTGAGGATALGDLTTEDTSGSGSTVLGNTATDPTMAVYAGSQNYYDAVMLGANTTLAGGNNLTPAASVAFQGTVDGAQTLTINSAETTFYTSVGTTTPLTELETIDGAGASTLGAGGGTFTINAGTVQFADAVTLDSGVTVEGSTAPTPATLVNFENTVDGGQTLTINSAATEFGANVGATTPLTELETIDGSGASTLADGGSAITINAGTVQFADAVTLDNGVTVEGSTAPAAATLVDFENTVDGMTAGNQNLTVNAATATFDDKVGNTGAGGATALGDLTTEDTSGSGSTVLGNTATDPTMAVYAGSQNYYDAVMLGANTTLAGGNNLTPAASVAFQGTVDGAQTLTINSAETTFYTSVGTTTPLTELETIDGAGASTLGAGGGTFTINAGTVQFADAVTLDSGVTVEGSTAPTPATLVNFENTVDGGQTLTINSAATEFGANVGATTPLTELETIDGSGASTLADGGSAITINAGTVQFADAVTLDNGVTVEGSTAPAAATLVDFENTVDGMTAGNQNLTVNAATATFDDKVGNTGAGGATALGDLTTEDTSGSGSTVLGNTATDPTMAVYAGSQNYYDAVMLGANTTLAGGNNLTPAASVAFQGTVDGAQTLTINSAETTFGGLVGNGTALSSVTVNGTAAINGGAVTTSGAQTYSGPVTLSQNTGLTATTIELAGVTGGGNNLTLDNSSVATLGGAETGLGILTADGAGTLQVNNTISGASVADSEGTTFNVASSPAVNTTGDQDYNDPVTLSQNTGLTATTIELAGVTGGGNNLTLDNSGLATLGGAETGLGILTADGAGTLQVNNTISGASVADSEGTTFNVASSPAVNTTGDQDYSGPVTLSQNTGLTATTIELAGVTGGGNNLTLDNSGVATLGGIENGSRALMANGTGTLLVNNPISWGSLVDNEATTLNVPADLADPISVAAITTIGNQKYNQPITLATPTDINGGSFTIDDLIKIEDQGIPFYENGIPQFVSSYSQDLTFLGALSPKEKKAESKPGKATPSKAPQIPAMVPPATSPYPPLEGSDQSQQTTLTPAAKNLLAASYFAN